MKINFTIIITILFYIQGCSDTDNGSLAITTDSNYSQKVDEIPDNKPILEDNKTDMTELDKNQSGNTDIDNVVDVVNRETMMIIGVRYKLIENDRIQEIDNAKVRIRKNSEYNFTELTLLSGRAKIIKGK